MTHAAAAPLIGPEFDSFLFASVGDDPSGQPVSVLSALARSDVDPWEEAAALARMSRKKAQARLTELIAALPGEPIAALSLDAIASDLVALLPRANNIVHRSLSDVRRSENVQAWLGLSVLVVLTAMALIISAPQSQGPGPSREFIRVDGEWLDETRFRQSPIISRELRERHVWRGERGHPLRSPCIRRGLQSWIAELS